MCQTSAFSSRLLWERIYSQRFLTLVCATLDVLARYNDAAENNPRSNRPERRTALVARELVSYKVDIVALSETRFSEQGQREEVGAGYTFFRSVCPMAERLGAGVAFAIRNDIVGRLPCLRQGINDRPVFFRFRVSMEANSSPSSAPTLPP
nr:unnamed protein product [Spirometra erinaceieuropaei]